MHRRTACRCVGMDRLPRLPRPLRGARSRQHRSLRRRQPGDRQTRLQDDAGAMCGCCCLWPELPFFMASRKPIAILWRHGIHRRTCPAQLNSAPGRRDASCRGAAGQGRRAPGRGPALGHPADATPASPSACWPSATWALARATWTVTGSATGSTSCSTACCAPGWARVRIRCDRRPPPARALLNLQTGSRAFQVGRGTTTSATTSTRRCSTSA